MHWNYRIMRRKDSAGDIYSVHEVYYNPTGWTEPIIDVGATSVEELISTLEMILTDAKKSKDDVLEYSDDAHIDDSDDDASIPESNEKS